MLFSHIQYKRINRRIVVHNMQHGAAIEIPFIIKNNNGDINLYMLYRE